MELCIDPVGGHIAERLWIFDHRDRQLTAGFYATLVTLFVLEFTYADRALLLPS